LQTLTQSYIILTAKEVEKWQDDSLDFFLNQKEESNEVSGNFLRNKAKALIAAISLRFGSTFEKFCGIIVNEFPSMKEGDIQSQLKKDAAYQILHIRLGDESNVEVAPLISQIQ
jgi:hypothetical protein